jgi:nicotinate-nucleotide adenylyltransferase
VGEPPERMGRDDKRVKYAIFGGTFDPIHNAHLRIAREAADRFGLDRVLFVTAGNPPHKAAGSTTPFEHRHHMVEMACAADPRFVASRIEEGAGKSYSIDTILKVKGSLAHGDELFFLIGADAFAEIQSWHRSADVVRAVEFIVVARPGYDYPVPAGAKVHRLETLALPVSSSEIRRLLDSGQQVQELEPGVIEYIRNNELYR